MYFDYLNVLVFAAVGLVFVFANLVLASILRPKRKTDVGLETYECGEETIGDAWIQFDIRYYTVALVYIIFAVEIAFSACVVESLIVTDRWLFLREHSDIIQDCWVEAVFDYRESPRNLVIVGIKK
jgi:NADH:ubiquinone oxidoreductase subunit 3 (subunit A)